MKTALLSVLLLSAFWNANANEHYMTFRTLLLEIREQRAAIIQEIETETNPAHRMEWQAELARLDDSEFRFDAKIKEFEARLDLSRPCPVCGGKLKAIEKVKDDRSKPCKNISVWLRHGKYMCGGPFGLNSPICTQCWMAQTFDTGAWIRRTTEVNAFRLPFHAAIRAMPLPPAKIRLGEVHYTQTMDEGERTDTVELCFKSNDGYFKGVRDFVLQNGLYLSARKFKDRIILRASTKPIRELVTPSLALAAPPTISPR